MRICLETGAECALTGCTGFDCALRAASSAQPAGSMPDVLTAVPMLEQRRDTLQDQLDDLYGVALRLGMRDACDWLRAKGIHRKPSNVAKHPTRTRAAGGRSE